MTIRSRAAAATATVPRPVRPAAATATVPLLLGTALLLSRPSPSAPQEAVYVVRHAEQVGVGEDPPLSTRGRARAAALQEFFLPVGLTAIYTTDLRRSVETGAWVAEPLGIEITPVHHDSLDVMIGRVEAEPPDARVLIVGHSNTVPMILEALGYPNEIMIEHDEFSDVFLLVPAAEGPTLVLRQRLMLPTNGRGSRRLR